MRRRIDVYSDQVIEHFKNPRNMGKPKEFNGVGKVGNPVCLLPETKLHLNGHLRSIRDVEVGDRVLSHRGDYSSVKAKSWREYHGKVLVLKNKLGKVALTPEHLVLAIHVPKRRKFFDYNAKKELTPAWYHAEDLEKRDIVLYPIPFMEQDIAHVALSVGKPRYDSKSKDLPAEVPLDEDFLRLAGYYLSEGGICERPCKTFLSFTFNIGEREYVNDVVSIVKKEFGIDAKTKDIPARKTTQVYVYSARLARLFKELFGKGAAKKRIPHGFMLLPPKKQKALLKGLWRGDGHMNLTRSNPRAGYASVSQELVQQIKLLLLRQRIVPSIYVEHAKEVKGVKHKTAYRIHVGDMDSLRRLASIMGTSFKYEKKEKTHSWFDEDYFYTPLACVESIEYDGEVENLEVDDSHSFATDSFCVHNCGDVMYLYINVRDNKIVDIGFETMGCAAAIATSSMITEMAKGKTLEEAEGITRADVSKALMGLPPIKEHCSNLAADALQEAIKDYKKKQGIE